MGLGEKGVLAPGNAGGGGVCLQAGMEDDGEEVYLPPVMGLGCVLAGGCIFLPQVCVCVCMWCRCTRGSARGVLHPQAAQGGVCALAGLWL